MIAVFALLLTLTVSAHAAPPPQDPDDAEITTDTPYPVLSSSSAPDDLDAFRLPALDGPCDCDAPTLARLAAHAPPLASIIARTDAVAGLASADDPTASWRRRSRWSALVPWFTVRGGNSESWRDITDPALAATSPAPNLNHAVTYDVRVGWRLDRLLYDPNEPRFTAFEIARRRDRRKLAALVSRAYFTWLRAAVAVERDARWQLRLSEAIGDLDALTDGWFSTQLAPSTKPNDQ